MITLKQMSATVHTKRYRPLFLLVTAALLVQSLFPSGTMPGNLSGGWVATLCPEGMPVAFMAQLQPSQTDSGPHAGHHGEHGNHASDNGGDHGADHQAVGDCQLGSQLDQPFTLTSQYTPGTSLQVDLAPVENSTAALFLREIYRQQPRAPPLS